MYKSINTNNDDDEIINDIDNIDENNDPSIFGNSIMLYFNNDYNKIRICCR